MRHLTIEQWADLARNVAPPEDVGKMQEHLGECAKCVQTLAIMKGIATVAAREGAYEPPAGAVRMSKSLMASRESGTVKTRVIEMWPPVFDSFLQPAMAGVRSAALTASRQLLYRKGDCCVDIRLDRAIGTNEISLIGQVLDSGQQGRGAGAIPVELMRGEEIIAGTTTNDFGEFQFSFPPAQDLRICSNVPGRCVFSIKIPSLDAIAERGLAVTD
ncbi:MAG TPA: hypothetical protein VN176_12990 [Verrucomicrobiae bacterium]|jgi:hypothetical protein|nr:hypothetical protein [Verrucomicrobiae bacterium]